MQFQFAAVILCIGMLSVSNNWKNVSNNKKHLFYMVVCTTIKLYVLLKVAYC